MCPKCELNFSTKIFFSLLSFVFITFLSLNSLATGDHGSHGAMDHSKMNHKEMTKKSSRKKLSEMSKKLVIKVLEANEKLHGTFFDYDGKQVETSAKELIAAIDAIDDTEVSKLLKFSKTKLNEIKASSPRDNNNQNYHLVSMALIHIVNTYDVGEKYNAYSCPMVKKKWVQNSKKMNKVHNPYAPNMPHCGSKDTNH